MIFNSRYEILESLGEGGFAVVWKAKDLELGRFVAIKLMKIAAADLAILDEMKQRLRREAKILSRLSHPNIVTVFSIEFLDDSTAYIVMEFLAGEPLSRFIAREGKLNYELVKEIALQTCEGLGYAHERGMIHRDLSSANLFLCENGNGKSVKIIDFGLSKSEMSASTNITKTGLLVGNPAYMSPEAILGQQLDNRADIYSLGCIVYEMVAGVQPFLTDNIVGLLFKHQKEYPEAPSLSSVDENDGKRINAIILRCLQKERELRFTSCKQIHDALSSEQALEEILPARLSSELLQQWISDSPKAATRPRFSFGIPMILGSSIVIVLSVFVGLRSLKPNSDTGKLSVENSKSNKQPLVSLARKKNSISLLQRQSIQELQDLARKRIGDPRQLYQKIMEGQIQYSGKWSVDHLLTYIDLAQFERVQEKYDDMAKYCQIVIDHSAGPKMGMDEKARAQLLTKANMMLAQSYWDRNNPDKAEPFALQALKTADLEQSELLTVLIGDVKLAQHKFNEAKLHYSKLALEAEPRPRDAYYMHALLGLSAIVAHNGSLAKAEQLQSKAASYAEENELTAHYAQRLFDLGMRFFYIDELKDAERLYKRSIKMISASNFDKNFDYIAHADLHWLGELYFKRGELDKAETQFKEVLAYEKRKGIRSWRGDKSIEKMQAIYEKQGNQKGLKDLEPIILSRSKLEKQ